MGTAQEYIKEAEKDENIAPKSWEFIKAHLPDHIFEDVVGKGATRNYTTKPNEKLHGPLKNAYRDQTNFKDVATQVITIIQLVMFAVTLTDIPLYTHRY